MLTQTQTLIPCNPHPDPNPKPEASVGTRGGGRERTLVSGAELRGLLGHLVRVRVRVGVRVRVRLVRLGSGLGLGFGFGVGLEPDLLWHRLGLSRRALGQLPAQGEGWG